MVLDKIDYTNWSKDDLVKEIKKLKKRKKYGIVWDEEKTKEKFSKESENKLPILKKVKSKEIQTGNNSPTNILIEGDNYHVLSVLNYTHKGKIDLIYIDPPYNRDGDFRYTDSFGETITIDKMDSYRHSTWLSYMFKRLKLARNLLTDDGLIFISIDENELAQLKLLCDDKELFREVNFISCITWRQLHTVKNSANYFSKSTEYILVYAKDKNNITKLREPKDKTDDYPHDDNDGKGRYKLDPIYARNKNKEYEFYFKKWDLKWSAPVGSYPRYALKELERMYENNEIVYKDGAKQPVAKRYLSNVQEGVPPSTHWIDETISDDISELLTYWDGKQVGFNLAATGELAEILTRDAFVSPKPVSLMQKIQEISFFKKTNGIVLDFMAGSGTTGHATLKLNNENGTNFQFILCTNNENEICTDVCYPRLQKVIKGYTNTKKEKVKGLGGNLKYFKTDFVDGEPTDKNKKKLVEQCTEMLCLKEDCFDEIKQTKTYSIFKNHEEKYLGIIYDDDGIEPLKKQIKSTDKKFNVYVFSLDDSAREEEFEDVKDMVDLKPIPEVILNVYRRIFR